MKIRTIILIGLVGLTPLATQAATQVFTTSTAYSTSETPFDLTLSKFDSNLGTLTGVNVAISLVSTGNKIELDNDAATTATATASFKHEFVSFSTSFGTGNAFKDSNGVLLATANSFKWNYSQDFALGATTGDTVGSFNQQIGSADYASWTPGSSGTISVTAGGDVRTSGINSYLQAVDDTNFTLSLNGSLPVAASTTASNLQFAISTPVNTYSATVTYTYTAIPEPSTYVLVAAAMALIFAIHARRQRD
jgi:hypothetical protein